MPRSVVLILALALALTTAAAAQQPASPDRRREQVDSLFARWDSTVSLPSTTLASIRGTGRICCAFPSSTFQSRACAIRERSTPVSSAGR